MYKRPVSCANRGDERRRIERMMSRCFTWFPKRGLGKPKLYHNMWCFTRMREFTWRVSNCEELSLARGGIKRPSHGFELNSQTHY